MDVQWFPGHMLKTQRLIEEHRSKVDVFLEVVDSRAPVATSNPLLTQLISGKPRVMLLNKVDLADPHANGAWKRYYDGLPETRSVLISCKERKNLPGIWAEAEELCKTKKWFGLRKIRAMIVGVPNVGKSSLINALSGGRKASVAPKPGHTKGLQRVNAGEKYDLLDTPGILWHKFDDPAIGLRLALLGSVKDEIIDTSELCVQAFRFLDASYPRLAETYFGAEWAGWKGLVPYGETAQNPQSDALEVEKGRVFAFLESWGKKRGMLAKGAEVAWDRLFQTFLSDFRTGKVGRVSLERPPTET